MTVGLEHYLIVSVVLFCAASLASATLAVLLAFGLTAIEAAFSDLFGLGVPADAPAHRFFCGNFGLVMLQALEKDKVLPVLRQMIRTTMVRGAQSAGIVTYRPHGHKRGGSQYGERSISTFSSGFNHAVSGRNMVITITDTPLSNGWAVYAIRPQVKATCA